MDKNILWWDILGSVQMIFFSSVRVSGSEALEVAVQRWYHDSVSGLLIVDIFVGSS